MKRKWVAGDFNKILGNWFYYTVNRKSDYLVLTEDVLIISSIVETK